MRTEKKKSSVSADETIDAPQKKRFIFLFLLSFSFLIYMLPIKFGSITGVPEIPFLPCDLMSWIIFSYSPMLFPIVSGFFLISAFLVFPRPRRMNFRMIIFIAWLVLAYVSLIGVFKASVKDFAILQVCHFSGIIVFSLALLYAVEGDSRAISFIRCAILLAALTLIAFGVNQYFWGFKESVDYVYQEEIKSGVKIAYGVRDRLMQTRLFTTFSLCNSYAAHLILVMPFCVTLIWKDVACMKIAMIMIITSVVYFIFPLANQTLFFLISFFYSASVVLIIFRFPEKMIGNFKIFTAAAVLAGFIFNLHYTGSRAAVLAFGLSLTLVVPLVLYAKFANARKALLICSIAAVGTAVFYFMIVGDRNLGSLLVRLDYYRVAIKIFIANPLSGTGWGDFFHEYTKLKSMAGTEAPHTPHNFALSFASQTGIVGLLAACIIIILPILAFMRDLFSNRNFDIFNVAVIIGWIAWTIHSLLDINIQIAGTVATAVCLLMLMKVNIPELSALDEKKLCFRPAFSFLWYQSASIMLFFALVISTYRIKGEFAFMELYNTCESRFSSGEDIRKIPIGKVEHELKECVKTMPYSPFPWAVAAGFFQRRGLWELSESCYLSAVNLSPERASYYYRLSYSQMKLGKKKESLENLEKAALLFPNAEYKTMLENYLKGKPAGISGQPLLSD